MSVVFISGDHPRHTCLAVRLEKAGLLSGWVRETREAFEPQPPDGLNRHLDTLFRLHFRRRAEAEDAFFGAVAADALHIAPRLDVAREDLNSGAVHRFIATLSPDLILSYGCHKLCPATLALAPLGWNTHGGLSPQYRGVITHFWPSYMLEPQMTGMTLHETTDALDGGAIIHQTGVAMVAGDGLHALAARAVRSYADDLPRVLAASLGQSARPRGIAQRGTGRLWTSQMWRPEHLTLIYETYDDRMVDRVLDGTLEGREPALISICR